MDVISIWHVAQLINPTIKGNILCSAKKFSLPAFFSECICENTILSSLDISPSEISTLTLGLLLLFLLLQSTRFINCAMVFHFLHSVIYSNLKWNVQSPMPVKLEYPRVQVIQGLFREQKANVMTHRPYFDWIFFFYCFFIWTNITFKNSFPRRDQVNYHLPFFSSVSFYLTLRKAFHISSLLLPTAHNTNSERAPCMDEHLTHSFWIARPCFTHALSFLTEMSQYNSIWTGKTISSHSIFLLALKLYYSRSALAWRLSIKASHCINVFRFCM